MKNLFLILAFIIQLTAQNYLLRSNGELVDIRSKQKQSEENLVNDKNITSILDTMSYQPWVDFDVQLGLGMQDILVQWFVAPADLVIKAFGFRCSQAGVPVHFKIVKLNWSESEVRQISYPKYIGFYPSEGDGYNNAGAFPFEATNEWIDKTGGEYFQPFDTEHWEYWDMGDFVWPYIPQEKDKADLTYQFFETYNSGYEPEVRQGEIIGIVIVNEGEDTTKFWSKRIDSENVIPGWKYYEYGKVSPDEPGWWAREYVFDFALAVEFSSGPRIFIYDVTQLTTTLSTEPRDVCCKISDDNPSGGPAGIKKVELIYTVNGGSESSIEMDSLGQGSYCSQIPRQEPGSEIAYYVKATDLNSYTGISNKITYTIFSPNTEANLLVVMNTYSLNRAELLLPYYMNFLNGEYDNWYYEEISTELLSNYSTFIEIGGTFAFPEYDNREITANWLDEGNKNYMLINQEALGVWNNFNDSIFAPGDFEYDYLGVRQSFNDVSYNSEDDSSMFHPSFVKFIGGTEIGDSGAISIEGSVWYDPYGIFGVQNWLDQFEPREDVNSEIFMTGYDWTQTNEKSVAHNFIDDKNNKIVFMTFDPLALQSNTIWVGDKSISPFVQALNWFEVTVDVKEEEIIPTKFYLAQNYPNPFNPSTKIKFTTPLHPSPYQGEGEGLVSLKVYDILGREVKTLLNKPMQPGRYEIEFNGTNLPSGVYFYRITAGYFIQTRKMILLK